MKNAIYYISLVVAISYAFFSKIVLWDNKTMLLGVAAILIIGDYIAMMIDRIQRYRRRSRRIYTK